jgi:hypothetical protein
LTDDGGRSLSWLAELFIIDRRRRYESETMVVTERKVFLFWPKLGLSWWVFFLKTKN